jgi:hypothetical protein
MKAGPLTKMLLKIAGVDEATLLQCPPHDWDNARAVGEIMICTWLYLAALFAMISQHLFAASGQIRPELVLTSMAIASFITLIDSYMIMRSGWHLSGIEELKRGGLDISGGAVARMKAGFFLTIRILLSIGIAQLTAIFLSLIIFGADIAARIEGPYLQANARLTSNATALVDGGIQRATEAVTVQSAQVAALSAQVTALRQNAIDPSSRDPQMRQAEEEVAQLLTRQAKSEDEMQSAETFASNELAGIKSDAGNSGQVGDGPRHRAAIEQVANAKSHAAEIAKALAAARDRLDTLRKQLASGNDATKQRADERLPGFENVLASENAKLANLKEQLNQLTQGRDDAIRKAVENAPDHVRRDDGFLAQIMALEHIAQADSKVLWIIALIDVTSFGLELAAVLAKVTSFVPTTYAALLARDAYLGAVRITNAMVAELNGGVRAEEKKPPLRPRAEPANDNHRGNGEDLGPDPFGGRNDPPPQPPKRPRGRPRKSTLN